MFNATLAGFSPNSRASTRPVSRAGTRPGSRAGTCPGSLSGSRRGSRADALGLNQNGLPSNILRVKNVNFHSIF